MKKKVTVGGGWHAACNDDDHWQPGMAEGDWLVRVGSGEKGRLVESQRGRED